MTQPLLSDRIKCLNAAAEELERMEQPDKETVNKALMLATEIVVEVLSQTHEALAQSRKFFSTIEKQAAKIEFLMDNNHQLAELIYKKEPPVHNITGRA